MNNLAYTSQDAAYVGAQVEEKVREEVGADARLPYQVETGEAGTATFGSFLSDIGNALVGGKDEALFRMHFDLTQRPAHRQISIRHRGHGRSVAVRIKLIVHNATSGGSRWTISL